MQEGTTSQFSPNRNCYINNKVTGAGTIRLNIPYLREYVQGDWSGFSGRLIANGVSGDKRGSLLLLDKSPKLNNTVIELKGNTNLCYWSTTGNQTLGGLSGAAGTYLNGSSKQADNFTCTWTVGSANTDETFRGIINNWSCSGSGHSGTVNIVKTGTGVWRLTGANEYKGTTVVHNGTLVVNGRHTGGGAITVNAGAALGGKGTLTGAVTIRKGGIMQVGDTLATDKGLTLSGGLKIEEGAVLRLNEAMATKTYADGASIRVFTGKATGAVFSQIEPERPSATQVWDTSKLMTDGMLYVRDDASSVYSGVKTVAPTNTPKYDLQGHRLEGAAKGLYIQDGKKHLRR